MSAKTAKYQTLAVAFRTVLAERIHVIKDSSVSEPLFFMAASECTAVEIQQNKAALSNFIDCSAELQNIVLDIPTVSKNALIALDDSFSLRLSKATTKGQQTAWARHEGDKFRSMWSYFLRLCKRSRWSNNLVLLSLKTQYFEKHRADTPATETQQAAVNIVHYPDSGNDDDSDDGVCLISSKPAPVPIGDEDSADVDAEASASAGTAAAAAEASGVVGAEASALAGTIAVGAEQTALVNLAPAPAGSTQRTRLAMSLTPKSVLKKPAAASAGKLTSGKRGAAAEDLDQPSKKTANISPEKRGAAAEDLDQPSKHTPKKSAAAADGITRDPKKVAVDEDDNITPEKMKGRRRRSAAAVARNIAQKPAVDLNDNIEKVAAKVAAAAAAVVAVEETIPAPATPAHVPLREPRRILRRGVSSPDAKKSNVIGRTPMSVARKAFAESRCRELAEVKKMNLRLSGIIEQKQIFMYTQAQGVINIAETITGVDASSNIGPMLEELGGDPHIEFQDVKCKLRLLSQRGDKIWQVVGPQKRALVQCNSNTPAPQLVSEVLLWLGCAGYGKESLQQARRIMQGW